MKVRGPSDSGVFQVLDELKLDMRVYEALERYVDDQGSGIDAQGVIQLALCYFLDPEVQSALDAPEKRRQRTRRS